MVEAVDSLFPLLTSDHFFILKWSIKGSLINLESPILAADSKETGLETLKVKNESHNGLIFRDNFKEADISCFSPSQSRVVMGHLKTMWIQYTTSYPGVPSSSSKQAPAVPGFSCNTCDFEAQSRQFRRRPQCNHQQLKRLSHTI